MTPDKNLDDILASIRKIVVEEPATATAGADPEIDDALLDPDFDSLPLTELLDDPIAAAAPPAVHVANLDIDATARALLQPMLKAWLDANLPEIVESAVAAEIKRLTGHG